MRPADLLSLLICAVLVAASYLAAWAPIGGATSAIVERGAGEPLQFSLERDQTIEVRGPLGITRIEIGEGRARIAASPCRDQRCVLKGWLSSPGDTSICLPNTVSLRIAGTPSGYDAVVH